MANKTFFLLLYIILLTRKAITVTNHTFPANFKFGVGTGSYQIEGAWNKDGKGENIWDHICHTNPDYIDNRDNGDTACDSYHKYKEDIVLLKNLRVDYYRFSIAWSRIVPLGTAGSPVNQAGINYYKKILQELVDNDIEAMITMYNWDLPQRLLEYGGFTSPEFEKHYEYYARILFREFGDSVKYWFTFNEPLQICYQGYGLGTMAPGYTSAGLADYKCSHNLLKAHARVYHIYQDEFKAQQKGSIGIVTDTSWYEPATGRPEDQEASERTLQFWYGWYMHPIVHGNYPSVMIDRIDERSKQQGFAVSRLPKFTDEEIEYIKGTHDFIALNTYTTVYAQAFGNETDLSVISVDSDLNVNLLYDDAWEDTGSSWLKIVPWGIRKLLRWINKNYNNTEIFITENGVSDKGGLNDTQRITYYREYLSNVLEAILSDGVNVTRYTAWSLLDNFEWLRGFSEKFGLFSVDFDSPEKLRTPKASAAYYTKVIATRCLFESCA